MTKAVHTRCGYCGKDSGHMEYEGQETWDYFCCKKHADLFDEGKISPRFKKELNKRHAELYGLNTVKTGKY